MGGSRKSGNQNQLGCAAVVLVLMLLAVALVVAIYVGLAALSVWFWRNEKLKLTKKQKVGVLVVGWAIVGGWTLWSWFGPKPTDDAASSGPSSSMAASSEAASSEDAALEADSAPAASAPASSAERAASSEAASAVPVAPSSGAVSEPPADSETQAVMVWVPTHGGTKYHNKASCSGMDDPKQVTLEEAEAMGFTPCGRCY